MRGGGGGAKKTRREGAGRGGGAGRDRKGQEETGRGRVIESREEERSLEESEHSHGNPRTSSTPHAVGDTVAMGTGDGKARGFYFIKEPTSSKASWEHWSQLTGAPSEAWLYP